MGRKAKQTWMNPEDFAAIRIALGFTQEEIAARLDLSQTQVAGYEVGRTPIPKPLALTMTAAKSGKIVLPLPPKKR